MCNHAASSLLLVVLACGKGEQHEPAPMPESMRGTYAQREEQLLGKIVGLQVEEKALRFSELTLAIVDGEATGSGDYRIGLAEASWEKGAKIKFAVDLISNVWGIVALATIKTCEELIAKRVAIHSPGAVSTAMLKDWIAKKCPANSKFEPIVISGSQNRAAACQWRRHGVNGRSL